MRQLKFRAWDKKTKKMYYLSEGKEHGIDYQISFWLGGCELVEITAERGGRVICGKDDTITGTRDDGEFMEFTGLKDKNGVEIYEGDILTNTIKQRRFIAPKNRSRGYYRNQKIVTKRIVEWNEWWASFDMHKHSERGEFEVIGNIYDNPELIK